MCMLCNCVSVMCFDLIRRRSLSIGISLVCAYCFKSLIAVLLSHSNLMLLMGVVGLVIILATVLIDLLRPSSSPTVVDLDGTVIGW